VNTPGAMLTTLVDDSSYQFFALEERFFQGPNNDSKLSSQQDKN